MKKLLPAIIIISIILLSWAWANAEVNLWDVCGPPEEEEEEETNENLSDD